jgi:NADPH:quinone reductase
MRVVELLAAGELDPQIGLRTSWTEVSEAAQALLDRRAAGKAVLDVD